MELLIAAILFIAVVLYVAFPVLFDEEAKAEPAFPVDKREQLLAEKEQLILNLKDIEMDYKMEKLSDEDYQRLKQEFEQRAIDVLRRLDEVADHEDSREASAHKAPA
ncbi:MAG TPA: hypothetical protein VLU25_03180 [Acidobacteriota bacterium]|nr:hypothetical protein [Acidobacteriota bacterium]